MTATFSPTLPDEGVGAASLFDAAVYDEVLPDRWFPFAPALARANGDMQLIADLMRVSLRTVQRWQKAGMIDMGLADELACRVGFHPFDVWPDWLEIPAG